MTATLRRGGGLHDLLRHTAVDDVALAGDVRGLVRRQPRDGRGDLFRLAGSPQWDFGVELLRVLFVARRLAYGGRDGVDADVAVGELERHCLGEHSERGFRGGVDGEAWPWNVLVHGRDVDDAAARSWHLPCGLLCEQEARADVDGERLVEVFVCQ